MKYLLSIITICKNDFNGIKSTIDSTRLFRESGIVQHIVVDSSDKSISEQIQSCIIEESIKYIHTPPNGISNAFNVGLQNVEGSWVWILNAGDCFMSDLSVSSMLDILKYNSADILFYKVRYVPSNIVSEFPPVWLLWPNTTLWAPHPSAFVKHKVFVNEGRFKESLKIAMDYEYWVKVFDKKYVVNIISIPIVDFDETGISITNKGMSQLEVRKIKLNYMASYIKTIIKKSILMFKSF